jgi:hypothetical protein
LLSTDLKLAQGTSLDKRSAWCLVEGREGSSPRKFCAAF